MNVLFRFTVIKLTLRNHNWTDQPFNLKGDNGAEDKHDPEDGAHDKSKPEDLWLRTRCCVQIVCLWKKKRFYLIA